MKDTYTYVSVQHSPNCNQVYMGLWQVRGSFILSNKPASSLAAWLFLAMASAPEAPHACSSQGESGGDSPCLLSRMSPWPDGVPWPLLANMILGKASVFSSPWKRKAKKMKNECWVTSGCRSLPYRSCFSFCLRSQKIQDSFFPD